MATSKTSSFWLTETVELSAAAAPGARASGTLDLGAYVDVGDQQGIAIEQIDYIWQVGVDFGSDIASMIVGNGSLGAQVADLNPGGLFLRADNNSLISSGVINGNSVDSSVFMGTDFFPDTFGKLDQARIVVNDSLFVVIGVDNTGINPLADVFCTVRIKCRIIKLSSKDWIAIAVQSTASDN